MACCRQWRVSSVPGVTRVECASVYLWRVVVSDVLVLSLVLHVLSVPLCSCGVLSSVTC